VFALGGATSAERTPEQLEIARFHSESPATVGTRNYRRSRSTASRSPTTLA